VSLPDSPTTTPETAAAVAALKNVQASVDKHKDAESDVIVSLRTSLGDVETVAASTVSELATAFTLFRDAVYTPASTRLSQAIAKFLANRSRFLRRRRSCLLWSASVRSSSAR
jgi:hypothetical protein